MGIEKFGTDAVELNTGTGGIVSADGLTLIDTGSSGETSTMLGSAVLREVQAGVANGTFTALPPDPDADITTDNPLPYWSWSPGTAITAAIVYDPAAASNSVVRFSIAAGAAVGDTATLTRFIPVASSASRSFSFYAEATCDNGSVSSQGTLQLTCQFYKVDQTTTTGTAFSSALYTFNEFAGVIGITAPDIYATTPDLINTTAPADAAYLKLTVTVQAAAAAVASVSRALTTATVNTSAVHNFVVGESVTMALSAGPAGYTALNGTWVITATPSTTQFRFTTVTSGTITLGAATGTASVSIARSVDLTEVRLAHGLPELLLTDKTNPGTKSPAFITNDDGQLTIREGTGESQFYLYEATTATTGAGVQTIGNFAIDAETVSANVQDYILLQSGADIELRATTSVDVWAPSGLTVTTDGSTLGTLNVGAIADTGDLTLAVGGGDVILQDSAADNPRLLFRDSAGTFFAGVKSGAANIVQILNGSSSTDYAYLYAERIYPMNGSTPSRYIYDNGSQLALSGSGGFDINGVAYLSGSLFSDAISTTTQTSSAAIWVLSTGTTYSLRRNTSSARYKTNIVDADSAVLEAAKRVKPRHYTSTIEDEAGATRLGFIAEEVQAAGLTHAVGLDAEGRPETLDSTALIAALFVRIEDLENRLAALEG
jgi:hypothetical protein